MGLKASRHKIAFLEERASPAFVSRLEEAFARARATLRLPSTYPAAALDALETDLLYCFARHKAWITVAIFPDVVAEFVTRDYALPRAATEDLIGEVLHAARALARDRDSARVSDREFLKYVLVNVASAEDEDRLVADLGLGVHLLARLKEAAESLANGKASELEACFVPEIDALFSEIMLEVSEEMTRVPWSADVHRLRYALWNSSGILGTAIEHYGVDGLFDVLAALGRARITDARQLGTWLAEKLPNLVAPEDEASVGQWLEALRRHELIFPEDARGGRWRLAPVGLELTAHAFAVRRIAEGLPQANEWRGMPPQYQKALVRHLGVMHAELLASIVREQPNGLAPDTFRAIIHTLTQAISQEEIEGLCVGCLKPTTTSWIRRAACEALQGLALSGATRQALHELAECDPSPGVREAAHGAVSRATGGRAARGGSLPAPLLA